MNEASLPRLDKDGNTVQKRPQTLTPEGVNLQDCIDDQKIRFTLQMSGYEARAKIRVWASIGQDCKPGTARGGGVQQCWPVYDSEIPLAPVVSVDIPVRKIMSGAPPFGATAPNATEEACGKVDLSSIGVQFLYFVPGDDVTATQAKNVTVTVDTQGPLPPSGLRALPGDTRIKVEWTNISGGSGDGGATGGLTELTGVKVYCDRSGGASADGGTTPAAPVCRDEPVDAGPDADAGEDAGTVRVCEDAGAPAGDCSSTNLVSADGSPVFPTADFKKFECGSITGNTGTSVIASGFEGAPLVNGTRYAVAIAATDRYGNVGELSPVVCEIPEETTDFWDEYRRAGGGAGGGCATHGADVPLGSLSAVGAGVAVAISAVRRRRSRR